MLFLMKVGERRMEIAFVNPGIDAMIEEILGFQSDGETGFWSDPLYSFYPQLDKAHALRLPLDERKTYIDQTMRAVYAELKATLNEKTTLYARHWAACKGQITAALSDAFEVDCAGMLNDLQCHVSLNPIEPRFLKEHRYSTFYLNSEKGAIGEAIHELIHFVWFHVWNQHFRDSYEEYERPSLKWILSEMVVESIMKDERLSSINPYFPRENGGCIYPYFFDMMVEGELILDTLDGLYRKQKIAAFMKSSYAYCLAHETAIREHIRRAENKP